MKTIFLDNHSTTQVDPEVFKAMEPYFMARYGNPSSLTHTYGIEADAAVENARNIVASKINALPEEIIFTASSTEAINLTHFGIAESYSKKGNHIITSNVEHSAVINSLEYLSKRGFEVTFLKVNEQGELNLEDLKRSIKSNTIMCSLMHVNNEIGTINNITEIGSICKENNIFFHTDGTQGLGKLEIDVVQSNISLASFSAHKIYGPKGIGFLYKRKDIKISPQLFGGGQESGLRSGTLNVPGIVGLSKAMTLFSKEENNRVKNLRDQLLNGLIAIEGVEINGTLSNRVTNNINVRFEDIKSIDLVKKIKDIAFSTGAACTNINPKPSRVLKAIGLTDEQTKQSIRIGLGRFNTQEEIDYAINKFQSAVKEIRESKLTYSKGN